MRVSGLVSYAPRTVPSGGSRSEGAWHNLLDVRQFVGQMKKGCPRRAEALTRKRGEEVFVK
jgi:hypothetical protein